jgi:hypothetical protein
MGKKVEVSILNQPFYCRRDEADYTALQPSSMKKKVISYIVNTLNAIIMAMMCVQTASEVRIKPRLNN